MSTHRSLDQRISDLLNGEIITSSELSDLIISVEDALPISSKALEAEKVRLVDPSNRDPEKTKQVWQHYWGFRSDPVGASNEAGTMFRNYET